MALGRGGDQVAIKTGEDYEFFGGLSKGVEKRDKVRTRVIAASLSDHIKASDTVLIMGHRFSDLDAIGAAIGMWSATAKGLKNLRILWSTAIRAWRCPSSKYGGYPFGRRSGNFYFPE